MSVPNIPLSSLFSRVMCTLKKWGKFKICCSMLHCHVGPGWLGNIWQILNADNGVANPKFSQRLDNMFGYSHIDIELKT